MPATKPRAFIINVGVNASHGASAIPQSKGTTMARSLHTLGILLLLCSVAQAKPRVGLFGLLCDVHAYSDGQTTYVPLLGIADWVGATVEIKKPDVYVTLDGTRLRLTMRSSVAFTDSGTPVIMFGRLQEIGGATCVPARFWEALGVTTSYVSPAWVGREPPNVANRMNNKPVLTFAHGDDVATVLIHLAPPDVVARVTADLENQCLTRWYDGGFNATLDYHGKQVQLGRYGVDWIMNVGEIVQGHFRANGPAEIGDSLYCDGPGFCDPLEYVYGVRQGKWRTILITELIDRSDWIGAGIPISLAHIWDIQL